MFHRHFKDFHHERCAHDGFGHEHRFGRHWRGGGFEPREGRMFDSGDLKLVILALVAEKPRHGYEIIKALEERVGGGYSPSPGVVEGLTADGDAEALAMAAIVREAMAK